MITRFLRNIIHLLKGRYRTIPFLVFWVGTKCTLKCKNCCNLIPYINQESYDYKELLNDVDFLAKYIKIKKFQIQGGEPFTQPHIDKIIAHIVSKNFKIIEIATNGTKLLNPETIKILQENKHIIIRISNYKCSQKLRERFIAQLEKNNLNYVLYDFLYDNGLWFDTGGINEKRADDYETTKTYKNCDEKFCHTLVNGKLELCGKIHAIKEIYGCRDTKNFSEIDVRKFRRSIFFRQGRLLYNLINFYRYIDLFKEQCRYCKIAEEKVEAAEQLTDGELRCQK